MQLGGMLGKLAFGYISNMAMNMQVCLLYIIQSLSVLMMILAIRKLVQ